MKKIIVSFAMAIIMVSGCSKPDSSPSGPPEAPPPSTNKSVIVSARNDFVLPPGATIQENITGVTITRNSGYQYLLIMPNPGYTVISGDSAAQIKRIDVGVLLTIMQNGVLKGAIISPSSVPFLAFSVAPDTNKGIFNTIGWH